MQNWGGIDTTYKRVPELKAALHLPRALTPAGVTHLRELHSEIYQCKELG